MLSFCLHSLLREYGWQFLRHVALPHPVRTAKALIQTRGLAFAGDSVATAPDDPRQSLAAPRAVVGVGFCLKPMDPPCMSGRFNHDCLYLERLMHSGSDHVPDCCRQCAIREIGILTFRTNAAFYIMTSAKDILFDLFKPALDESRFAAGLFVLCRYSLEPFAVGLLVSRIRGWMFPFEHGDCRDYKTWVRADRGVKDEQTSCSTQAYQALTQLLQDAAQEPAAARSVTRRGNILYPEATVTPACR